MTFSITAITAVVLDWTLGLVMPPRTKVLPALTALEQQRFWSHVDKSAGPNGCWYWTAFRSEHNYGKVTVSNGQHCLAHRVAFEIGHGRKIGRDIDGHLFTIDHLCANAAATPEEAYECRACVNPAHLAEKTQRANVYSSDRVICTENAKKTHCKNGHPLSGDNMRLDITKRGLQRQCRTCDRERQRRKTAAKKAARAAARLDRANKSVDMTSVLDSIRKAV